MNKQTDTNGKGFTLVELLVVLAIVAILSAAAAPSVSQWVQNYRAKTTARQLMTDLQSARMKAVSQMFEYRVSVDTANNQYLIYKGDSSSGSLNWAPVGVARKMTDASNPYYAQGIVLGANCSPNTLHIIFSPLGNATFNTAKADGTAQATVTQAGATPWNVIVNPMGSMKITGGPNFAL